MGPQQLDEQIKALRLRAARYREIGDLLGDAEVTEKLSRLAGELEGASWKLEYARDLIARTIEASHAFWAGPNFDFLKAKLQAQQGLPAASRLVRAADWRKAAKLWVEEAESAKNHPDKALLAERAFEIAQLAEKLATTP